MDLITAYLIYGGGPGSGRHKEDYTEQSDEEREKQDQEQMNQMSDPRKLGSSNDKDPTMWKKGDSVTDDSGKKGTVSWSASPMGAKVVWNDGTTELVKPTIGYRRDVRRVKE